MNNRSDRASRGAPRRDIALFTHRSIAPRTSSTCCAAASTASRIGDVRGNRQPARAVRVLRTESPRCELAHDRSDVRVTMVQLPALNTPQFGLVRTDFASRPQPVPPTFHPEVAAEAIVWAADHPRREYWIAWATARAILANR